MNKRSMRTKMNLAITVMMAIVGIAVICMENMLFGFRVDGGYRDFTFGSKYILCLFSTLVCVVELVIQLLGTGCLLVGLVGVYNNIKKLMR